MKEMSKKGLLTTDWNVSKANVREVITPYSSFTVCLMVALVSSSNLSLLWKAQTPAAISAVNTSKKQQKN